MATEAKATGPQILLIDDDASLRQMYSIILTEAGFRVETADGGVSGLAKAREGGYNLILLDLVMPQLDGIRVLQALAKEPPKRKNGPIVILSNAGYDAVAQEARTLGAKAFLMKADLLPRDLVTEVKKLLA